MDIVAPVLDMAFWLLDMENFPERNITELRIPGELLGEMMALCFFKETEMEKDIVVYKLHPNSHFLDRVSIMIFID